MHLASVDLPEPALPVTKMRFMFSLTVWFFPPLLEKSIFASFPERSIQRADRMIDVFPPHQQQQVRMQLANVLLGVISQRLLPRVQGGRVLATEIMVANSAVRNTIREGKTHQLPNIIQTSASEGMIALDKVLAELVSRGEITMEAAYQYSLNPKGLEQLM